MHYKQTEIQSHFDTFMTENSDSIKNGDIDLNDLHHEIFNTDYYIIGRDLAVTWLDSHVFKIIEIIKDYESMHFGEIYTDFSEPENIANMYVYIIGEEIVGEYMRTVA